MAASPSAGSAGSPTLTNIPPPATTSRNTGRRTGWIGRLADDHYNPATRNIIVNIGTAQSLAVRSGKHSPLVFDDPSRLRREGTDAEKRVLGTLSEEQGTSNPTL